MAEEPPSNVTSGGDVSVSVAAAGVTTMTGAVKVWLSTNFASSWYQDAKAEATGSGDVRGRCRREILFSVAAAESYLFEWVRDEVLNRDFARLNEYFPPDKRTRKRGVLEKWQYTTEKLARKGLISSKPSFAGETWQEFDCLVGFRNGLLHARASRPQSAGLPDEEMPVPSMEDFQKMEPGWAVGVITAVIRDLHAAAGTKPPDWFGSK
ncbi:hypothetical protein SBA7_1620010 [Candidatus Sulfotelmatobacter sp. SbA7]|nr:hypothetical protein SBA7_1620010 [Candidatus Sulfotelmatobacter sp. SbA7]